MLNAERLIFVSTFCAVIRKLFPGLKSIGDVETITDDEKKLTYRKAP